MLTQQLKANFKGEIFYPIHFVVYEPSRLPLGNVKITVTK